MCGRLGSWRRRELSVVGLLAAALLVTGCKRKPAVEQDPPVVGSGVPKTLEQTPPPFTSLHVGGTIQAKYSPGAPHVTLRGDENLLPFIIIESTPGRLSLSQKRALKPAMSLTAEIAGPPLTELIVDIASRVTVEGLHSEHLRILGAGAAKLTARGSADELEVNADLAADLDLSGLSVRKARVTAGTASRVTLGYVEELDVETRAVAHVSYAGDPKITRSVGKPPIKRQ